MAAKKATTTSKTTKAAAKKTTTEKTPVEKAPKLVERDSFGAALTSQVARINAALSNEPQSSKQIAEAANANQSATQSHLRTLKNKDLIEKTADGYILKQQAKPKTTRKRSAKK